MIVDKDLAMADATSLASATAASRNVSDIIDLGGAGWDADEELFFTLRVVDAFTATGGAMNCTFSLETHTAADFSSARTVLWTSGALAKATLVAGYVAKAFMRLPRDMYRYLAVVAVPDTNTVTAGSYDAILVKTPDTNV